MEAINRLIARMEEQEKKQNEAGPSRRAKTRSRLFNLVVTSSDSDSEPETNSIWTTRTRHNASTQESVAGPSTSGPSTSSPRPGSSKSYVSSEVPSTSTQVLLDLRTEKKPFPPQNKREHRWESDESDQPDTHTQCGTTFTPISLVAHCSDSSMSPQNGRYGQLMDDETRGLAGLQRLRRGESKANRYELQNVFDPRPENVSDSSSSEPLFAPETTSNSSFSETLFGERDEEDPYARHERVVSVSPPRHVSSSLTERMQDSPLDNRPHTSANTFGESSRLGPRNLFRPYSSEEEDDSGLLDLSVASGPLPDVGVIGSRTSNPSHPLGPSDGYWSEAHDWMRNLNK